MRTLLLALAFASFAFLGCGGGRPAADLGTPEGAVIAPLEALSNGNLAGFLEATMPGPVLADAEQWWDENRHSLSEEGDTDQFEEMMSTLTRPGAAEELFALAKPQLQEIQGMMPFLSAGMGQVMTSMPKAEGMTDEQHRQAKQVMAALVRWAEDLDITDEDKLREAIEIVCATARKLDIARIEDLERCSFDQAIAKGSVLTAGLMDVFAVYDFDVREILDSVEIENVQDYGNRAVVQYTMDFLGEEMTIEAELEKRGNKWFPAGSDELSEQLKAGF